MATRPVLNLPELNGVAPRRLLARGATSLPEATGQVAGSEARVPTGPQVEVYYPTRSVESDAVEHYVRVVRS